jgi:alanyl-tRNA synthetase
MTERLYYADPYCREFEATVREVQSRGDRVAIALDRTAFYPTSGGQPFDTGALDRFRVVDVLDEDDAIVHLIDAEGGQVPTAGQRVRGVLDWQRRFDHMQQHSGQHVLSAACDRLFGARTVSFHLGASSSTIDLNRELPPPDIVAAEAEVNRVIWEDRPVTVRFVTAEEAAALPLRKESAREGTLRLIDIDGFDLSACGGTHVARTGSIGAIAIGTVERFKGGQRVEFFCGGRVVERFRAMRDTLGGAVRLLSVLPDQVAPAIERLQAESRDRQKSVAALETELAGFRAADLAAGAVPIPAGRLVIAAVDGDANMLKSLASAVASRPGHVAVLVSKTRPVLVVIARAKDVGAAANQMVTELIKAFGGRGGGRPELAQAGGLDGAPEAILDAARSLFERRDR